MDVMRLMQGVEFFFLVKSQRANSTQLLLDLGFSFKSGCGFTKGPFGISLGDKYLEKAAGFRIFGCPRTCAAHVGWGKLSDIRRLLFHAMER